MTIALRYNKGEWRELHDGPEGGPKEEYYRSTEHDVVDEDVEEIDLSGRGIISIDLSPLINCTNLQTLNLSQNQLSSIDLAPLGSCTNLKKLILSHNCLRDIDFSSFSRCTNLQKIDISSSCLRKIELSPLRACTNLQSLIIGNSGRYGLRHINLEPLSSCTMLQVFWLENRTIEDTLRSINLAPLSNCTQLRIFELIGEVKNRNIDISPFSACTNLQSLVINGSELVTIDLSPLRSSTGLEKLVIVGNRLKTIDLSPLSACTDLQKLHLYSNQLRIVDLSPLATCTNLTELLLFDNRLKTIDLSPLSSCTHLHTLRLDVNQLKAIDLSPLATRTNLTELLLSRNQLKTIDLSPLSACTDLQKLHLYNNQLQTIDLSPLATCTNLTGLLLFNNQLQSINLNPLKTCTKLEKLDLKYNGLQTLDLSPVSSFSSLDMSWIDKKKTKVKLGTIDVTPGVLTLDDEYTSFSDYITLTTWLDTELFKILAPSAYYDNLKRIKEYNIDSESIESWSSIYDFVELVKGTSRYIELTNGILRRLGLEYLGIIDKDLTDLFLSTSRDMSLDDVRCFVEPEVARTISQQIDNKGTTIGLDVAKASKFGELAKRIQDILSLRTKEVEWILSQKLKLDSLDEIVHSAYGFEVISAHDVFQRQDQRNAYPYFDSSIVNAFMKIVKNLNIKGASKLKGKPYVTSISEECKKYITQQAFFS